MKIGSLKALAAAGVLLVFGALATPASAQRSDDAGMQNAQNACQGDAYKFCSDAIPDRAKVASCLFKHKREISPACRTVIGGGKGDGKKAAGKTRKGKHKAHRRHKPS
jgi:hypothetical protein